MEEQRVHHAEDGRVGADTEGQGQTSHGAEARRLVQHAQAEARILVQIVQPPPSPSVPRNLLHQFHVPKLSPGRTLRLPFLLAALCPLLCRHLQMAPHFLFQFLLLPPFAKESISASSWQPLFPASNSCFPISIRIGAPPSDRPSSPSVQGYSTRAGLPY